MGRCVVDGIAGDDRYRNKRLTEGPAKDTDPDMARAKSATRQNPSPRKHQRGSGDPRKGTDRKPNEKRGQRGDQWRGWVARHKDRRARKHRRSVRTGNAAWSNIRDGILKRLTEKMKSNRSMNKENVRSIARWIVKWVRAHKGGRRKQIAMGIADTLLLHAHRRRNEHGDDAAQWLRRSTSIIFIYNECLFRHRELCHLWHKQIRRIVYDTQRANEYVKRVTPGQKRRKGLVKHVVGIWIEHGLCSKGLWYEVLARIGREQYTVKDTYDGRVVKEVREVTARVQVPTVQTTVPTVTVAPWNETNSMGGPPRARCLECGFRIWPGQRPCTRKK